MRIYTYHVEYIHHHPVSLFSTIYLSFFFVHLSANCNTKSSDPRNFNANEENGMLSKWIHMEMHVHHNSLEYAHKRMECVRDHLMMLNISSTALFPVRSIWAAQQPAFYLQSSHFYFLNVFHCFFFFPEILVPIYSNEVFLCVCCLRRELFRDRTKNVSLEKSHWKKRWSKKCSWFFFCMHYFSGN